MRGITTNTYPLRSNLAEGSARWAVRRAEWRALGITDEEMLRPKVAVINSSSDLAACFSHLNGIVPVLKDELRAEGCLPFEIPTIAPSDFVTSAGRGGRYVLPARNLIVDDIEAMVEGAQLDAMICLSSCDKTAPAHLMAAVRLNIPTVIIACGYQRNARYEEGGMDIEEVFLKTSQSALNGTSVEEVRALSESAIRGPGVCAGLGTANSMHIAAEALGMAVPGSTPVRANSGRMWASVRQSARALAAMIANDTRPRDIVTAGSIRNAATVMLSIGASINSIKHLQAIAVEAGLDLDMWGYYKERAGEVPLLCAVRPNGPALIEELEDAGGTATVMRELSPLLDLDQRGIDGRSVREILRDAAPADGQVIRTLADPFSTDPSIVVVQGSLARDGGVVKLPVGERRAQRFAGPARVYHSREEAIDALVAGQITAGDVVVIRGIGLIGGPGMGMVSAFIFALDGSGLGDKVAVVTDGQLSGLVNKGIVVGEVSPEAATGGALGLVRDGDTITIDLPARSVSLDVDPGELAARPPYQPADAGGPGRMLENFRATAGPLSCGATRCGAARSAIARPVTEER